VGGERVWVEKEGVGGGERDEEKESVARAPEREREREKERKLEHVSRRNLTTHNQLGR